MRSVYRPTYYDRHRVKQTSSVWWVRYRQHGKTVRESTETDNERQAKLFLHAREGKVALHIPVVPKADRLTLGAAADLVRHDYGTNGHKSVDTLNFRLAHLLAHFGAEARLARLTTAHVEQYKTARLAAKATNATVNRELAALGRMATLARHQHGLTVPFRIATLDERNVRTGFFEDDALAAVCAHLRPELAALATVAQLTGWRKAELCSRQWRHVDFAAGWLRLEPEETKNRDGRMFPLIPELRAVLEAQRARVDALQAATGQVIPWVFCRDAGGPIKSVTKAWERACIAAGFYRDVPVLDGGGQPVVDTDGLPVTVKKPTKLVHDFRRTAVRNLIRAGIPETVAMKLTGHKTRSIFTRYAIVEEGMLREAGDRLAAPA
jgi:integrase